jgi:DNA-directed RNA polymerase subunit omega
MARITVEDCLEKVDNRFTLVHLAAKRVRQLKKGAEPLIKCKNREVVTALREIAAGLITQDSLNQIENMAPNVEEPVALDIDSEEFDEEYSEE